ncbi:MAG: hypothetical protein AAFY46_16680, partial [Planctomycetota bacterium]
ARYDKRLLPTYDVFDEWRYFVPGGRPVVIDVVGQRVGLSICEDLWGGIDAGAQSRYADESDPIAQLIDAGATVIVNPSASPFVSGKHERHHAIVSECANRHGVSVLSVNQFGANDDLVFDGAALAHIASGLIGENARWSGDALTVNLNSNDVVQRATINDACELVEALTLGVRDYMNKCGFSTACLGLSGGIDSAVTAAIAARAVGGSHLIGIAMPSKYSSTHSIEDAYDLAGRIGCRCHKAPIRDPFEGYRGVLDTLFGKLLRGAGLGAVRDLTYDARRAYYDAHRSGAGVLTGRKRTSVSIFPLMVEPPRRHREPWWVHPALRGEGERLGSDRAWVPAVCLCAAAT